MQESEDASATLEEGEIDHGSTLHFVASGVGSAAGPRQLSVLVAPVAVNYGFDG